MHSNAMYAAEAPLFDAESGKEGSIQDDFCFRNNVANTDIRIRMAFIRKVYGLLSVQLLITSVISAAFMLCKPIQLFIEENTWLLGISFIATLFMLIPLHLKRKEHPVNLILLTSFTCIQSVSVGFLVSLFDTSLVLEALVITFAAVIALTAFTFQTKTDFSFLYGGLFAGLAILIVAGFLQFFFSNTVLELVIGVFGAVLFSLYIIYDTQMLLTKLSAEEYVLATISLYLDILNLFIYILRILAASRK